MTQSTRYYYVVVAVGTGGDSPASPQATAITDVRCTDHSDEGVPGTNIGDLDGDAFSTATRTGALCREDTDWFSVHVLESSGASRPLSMQVRLISSALGDSNVPIQLCVWANSVGGQPLACLNGTDSRITATAQDVVGPDDDFILYIRARYLSPATQSGYTLQLTGDSGCLAGATCVAVP